MGLFVLRLFRKLRGLHLIAPLAVLILVETIAAHSDWRARGFGVWFLDWLWSTEALRTLSSVYGTFVAIYLWLLWKEGATQVTDIGAVDDVLLGASAYFAVSPTPIRDWFEPAAQAYLTKVIEHKNAEPALLHQRVQLFFTQADLQATQASHLDGHHARCFAAWHEHLGVNLAFLKPPEVLNAIDAMTETERRYLLGWHYYLGLGWSGFRPTCLRLRALRRTRRLAFALVERGPNQPAIVLFKNKRHTLTITVLQTHLQIAAYARLAAEVRALTYVAGRNTFLESKKFARFISL